MCENGFACSALDHHLDPDRAGTEGDFSTMSVKVPPPSTPMRQGATMGTGNAVMPGGRSSAATAPAGDPDILHDEQAGRVFANY